MALFDFLQRKAPAAAPVQERGYLPSWMLRPVNGKKAVKEDTSLTVSAVYACVDRISSSLASVPFNIYERTADGRRLARNYDQYRLLHSSPSPGITSYQFRRQLIAHALLWGNGYAYMERNASSTRPASYRIIHPADVQEILMEEGEPYYKIKDFPEPVPYWDIIHITALTTDGIMGKSPIQLHRDTIGAALGRSEYADSIMANGGYVSAVIESDAVIPDNVKQGLKDSWTSQYGGSANAGKVAILDRGLKLRPMSMPLTDQQYIESQKFGVEEIARIFGVPLHLIGSLDRATFSNIEQQSIEFVQNCLRPWAVNIEQAFDSKIFRILERDEMRFYTKFELNGLLRGDLNARKEYYSTMIQFGVMSINEVRALEEMNNIAEGDRYFVQANMIPLDMAGEQYTNNGNGDA